MGSREQSRATSVASNDPLPYPGPKSPSPLEDAPYFPEPSREPISPETALNILQTYGTTTDVTTLQVITFGLVGTLKKRELDHQEEKKKLIQEREEAEEHLDHIYNTPDGYIENDGQASGFIITTRNGEYEPAYYVKRLPEG